MALTAHAWLPMDIADFTGRDGEVAAAVETLTGRPVAAPPIVLLAGMPGIGKSALAVHVAHQVAEHYPDGLLYVNLRGAQDDPVDPVPVLGAFLTALDVESSLIPHDAAERAALFRSSIADLRVLLLLDDASDAEQVRSLLPGTGGCAALITSRNRAFGLAGADVRLLDRLSTEESARLLGGLIGPERALAEPEALTELAHECGRLPLALRIAGSQLLARPASTVATMVRQLADERRSSRMLRSGGEAVEAAFAMSYGQLEATQQQAFRACAMPDVPDFGPEMAAAALRCSATEAEGLLAGLVDLGLLGPARPGRYAYHDLMRQYARAAGGEGDDVLAGRAVCAAVEYLRGGAVAAYERLLPGDMLVGKFTGSSTFGRDFAEAPDAFEWFTREYEGIAAVLRQAAHFPGALAQAAELAVASSAYLAPTLRWREAEPAFRALLSAADAADDQVARAWLAYVLSQTMNFTHRYEEARWFGALGEEACAAAGAECAGLLSCVLLQSAGAAMSVQDYDRALAAAGRVAELAAVTSDRAMAAWSHLLLAEAHRGLDQIPEAESELRAAGAARARESARSSYAE